MTKKKRPSFPQYDLDTPKKRNPRRYSMKRPASKKAPDYAEQLASLRSAKGLESPTR